MPDNRRRRKWNLQNPIKSARKRMIHKYRKKESHNIRISSYNISIGYPQQSIFYIHFARQQPKWAHYNFKGGFIAFLCCCCCCCSLLLFEILIFFLISCHFLCPTFSSLLPFYYFAWYPFHGAVEAVRMDRRRRRGHFVDVVVLVRRKNSPKPSITCDSSACIDHVNVFLFTSPALFVCCAHQ